MAQLSDVTAAPVVLISRQRSSQNKKKKTGFKQSSDGL